MKYIPDRYAPMYREIAETKPRSILEIGTHDGLNALRMLKLTNAAYYGFDLFEQLDRKTFRREFALQPPSKRQVEKHLRGHNVKLYSGDTRTSRAWDDLPKMDLIFIDGGHSEETVAFDWKNAQRLMHDNTVVYFDDYPNWGVGPVVDSIKGFDVSIQPEYDVFGGKPFHLARVTMSRA